jgi:PPOX class probable F420-dependent enzyme
MNQSRKEAKTMSKLSDSMREFLRKRHYATLATINEDGSIHLTPVQYLFENDRFYVSTAVDRKVKNISTRPQASVLVDTRKKQGAERWVSAAGAAEIIGGEQSKEITAKISQRYLTKAGLEDPAVGPVFAAAGEVSVCLNPNAWRSWEMKTLDEQYFGGVLGQAPEKWFLPVD